MGLTFLFSGVLFALPLAALPVILHLLFRRKSPVMEFSTIRFIKASMQQTATRKRVQKWILLGCRILLLAILIAAVAQPARLLAGGWSSAGKSSIAAIVVDTSYSMELEEHHEPLLARADASVRELLRGQLAGSKVAIFHSQPPPAGEVEQLQNPAALLGQWISLTPTANTRPLVDRIASAADLLDREHADDKWLIVISDFQKREFPSTFPQPKGVHIALIDLHPEEPRSAGITRIAIDPPQPTPGIGAQAVVDITGRASSTKTVSVSVSTPAGASLLSTGVQLATLDSSGHARLRFPLHLPASPWMLLKASLSDEDDMPWDNSRTQLIQTPPRQVVSFLGKRPGPDSRAYPVWLAARSKRGDASRSMVTCGEGRERYRRRCECGDLACRRLAQRCAGGIASELRPRGWNGHFISAPGA